MSRKQATSNAPKQGLHPRNRHRNRYDFGQLTKALPELARFVLVNRYGNQSLDFADPLAVKMLNRALLKQFYGIDNWDLPAGYLCPPIPGRADYIHHLADLLAASNGGVIPRGRGITGLDIGVGANCVYPLIGCREYGWSFVGSDVDPVSINGANLIATSNPSLANQIECRLQSSAEDIFKGIVQAQECFDFTLCNPPFHASRKDAAAGTRQKLNNLARSRGKRAGEQRAGRGMPALNFGGQSNELWCAGGEIAFIRRMIAQSVDIADQCFWFSTLVSKQENLPAVYRALKKAGAAEVNTVKMAQGQKVSRFVAWTFLDGAQRDRWRKERWGG